MIGKSEALCVYKAHVVDDSVAIYILNTGTYLLMARPKELLL